MPLSQTLMNALVAGTLFWTGATQAKTQWEALVLNDQGLFYIDPKSISEENGRKQLWSVLDYKQTQSTPGGKSYQSIHSQIQLNCQMKLARVVHLTYYSGPMLSGQVIDRQGMLHEWLDIDPKSPMQKIARRVC